jgi:hypothetical protein
VGARGRWKRHLKFLLCCRCCQAPLNIFSFLHSLGAVSHRPDWSGGFCGVGTSRLQRPSIRAGSTTRHPILYASFDESWKACGRRPHLSDGFLERPGSSTGRLHQHQVRGLTQHRHTAYAALRSAPSGRSPVSRKRHRAMRTYAPPRPSQCVSGASLLHHSARATSHSGHSPAGHAPHSRPTPWSSSAHVDCPTW